MTDYGEQPNAGVYPGAKKAPAEVRDFVLNWLKDLGGSTISASSWEVEGLTASAETSTSYTTTVTLEGGRDGYLYEAANTITTNDGQTFVKTLVVKVEGVDAETLSEGAGLDLEGGNYDVLIEDGNRLLLE